MNLFNKFDEDGSGEVDINKMRALLFESDMNFDKDKARELLEELDQNKSGHIDFEEICTFLASNNAGDVKIKRFDARADTLDATSVAILEKEGLKRHLKISYHLVSERPATVPNPVKTYVMEVRLEGEWIEPSEEGDMKCSIGMRRFQGIGKTTREGRIIAAEAALAKLHGLMPGLEVPHGTLPAKWEWWLKYNAKQGISVQSLLALLREKGFAPYANPGVMQWASAFANFDRLIGEYPEANPTVDDGRELGPGLRAWIDHHLSIGIERAVLVEVLQDKGISTSRMEAYAQRLGRGDGASCAEVVYPRLLDFWMVELYLSAGQPPNEAALYLPRGTVSLPLALAASRGHCEIMDALVSRKADVGATDMMGRTALHHAAKYGDAKACIRLLEHSAPLSVKDSSGCTPLHMAARHNKPDCCELLAFHGEETLRKVVNDRIPVAERPFTEILEASFHHLLKTKLRSNETHHFRKEWIYDAVCWCQDQMHEDKRWLLQEPSRELVEFVVRRFDPDPEAGFWQLKAGHPPTFVPSVAEPWHLSEMIRHAFRLAVCGSTDNRGWTALHQACFENRISSHEETIRVLANFHLHNFFQVDNNDKLAIELLFTSDNGRLNTPSGSRLKEALLIDQRKEVLAEDRERQDAEDEEKKEKSREEILRRIRRNAIDMDNKLWLVTQEASGFRRCLRRGTSYPGATTASSYCVMEYVDTETLNRFYYRNEVVQRVDEKSQDKPKGAIGSLMKLASKHKTTTSASTSSTPAPFQDTTRAQTPLPRHAIGARAETGQLESGGGNGADLDGDEAEEESIDRFQWDKPQGFAKEEAYMLGWASVINGSEFIRTHAGRYNAVLDCKTGVVFYVDTSNEACLLAPPREATLSWAFEHSVPTTRLLGQDRDWEMRIDQDGNEFYCLEKMERVKRSRVVEKVLTRDLRWEQPADAVQPVDLTAGDYALCTMDVAGYERTEQPWYICLECDAEWKGNMEIFRVCVACARNCHKGRLGHRTRFCKISNTRCMCCERHEGSCLYFSKKEEVVHGSLERRCTSADEKASLDAAEELARISPPILAYVPELWPDGTQKDVCGWQICRRKSNAPIANGWIVCHDPELPRRIPIGANVRPRCTRDAKVEICSGEQANARRAQKARITKEVFFWRSGYVVRAASDDWYTLRIQGRATDDTSAEENGLAKAEPLEWEFSKDRLSIEGSPVFFFHQERRESTWGPPPETALGNPSWPKKRDEISLTSAANQVSGKPETTDHDDRRTSKIVAEGAEKDGRASRRGNATLDAHTKGDEDERDLEVISSAPVRTLTGNDFNGDRHDGTDANKALSKNIQMFSCGYPPLYLDEWESMQKTAKVLYTRGRYTTYLDRETASVFYHDQISAALGKFVMMVQRKWRRMERQKGDKRIPPRPRTEAFSFEPPEELGEQMKLCTAWAYLRRGALFVRQVRDRDNDVWEEYQDRSTGLRFFYCPDLIKSRFHQPDLLPPASKESSSKTRLNVGDRVAFRFRGDALPSTAEVVKVRETQDRTDAGDTVHSVHYDVTDCEITRSRSHSAGSTSTSSAGGGVGPRTERWLSRRVLTKAPKIADEIALDEQEIAWRQELAAAKSRRQKELSRRVDEKYRAERLRKRGPAGIMLARRERGKTVLQAAERKINRAEAEKALREEEERLAIVKAQKASQELLSAITRQAKTKNKGPIKHQRTKLKQLSSKALVPTSERSPRGYSTNKSVEAGTDNSAFPASMNAKCGGTYDHKELLDLHTNEQRSADAHHDQEPYRQISAPQEDRMTVRQESLRRREDIMTTPRTAKRRRLIRMVHMAMVRQAEGFLICEWGCKAWVRQGEEVFFHQTEQCCKRIIPCELGCGLRMRKEEWLGPSRAEPKASCQQQHEEAECPRRLVPCKQRCGEWLPFEELMHHMTVSCVKRPFPPIKCRLGCGETFEGELHRMLQSEEERIDHEHEVCPHRLLHCAWAGCEEMVMTKDSKKHREEHIIRSGVFLFAVPGKYTFKVPSGCRRLKVQAWGAGGGSGHFKGGQSGDGGGGAFAEALVHVSPNDELEITVGGCGSAGVYGSEVVVPGGEDLFGKTVTDVVDQHGEAEGGWPGGGAGHGGNLHWAAGGGGGYSTVAKKVGRYGEGGTEPLVVAGGGGGGGSRAGVPGGGLNGEIPGTKVDIRNGRMGTATTGGAAGDSGDINGCTFPPKRGQSWQGGDGGQYGGGGGSGWFGGGGGGTAPGIVGGGGGGSSFINTAVAMDFVVLQGIGQHVGGMDRTPPRARGLDEGDIVGGNCGAGGKAGPWELNPGKNGAVRLHKLGFFEKQLDHN